jgi:Flp pilus assembly protein TadB
MAKSIALIASTVTIVCITFYVSYVVTFWAVDNKTLGKAIGNSVLETLRKTRTELPKITGGLSKGEPVDMTIFDKLQLKYIDRSGITTYFPFLNGGTLLTLCLFIMVLVFRPVFRIVNYLPSALVVSALFSAIPIFLLDIMARHNSAKVRRCLAEFVSILNRWCAVKEDVFYAFEKSLESGLKEPLATYIRDMVIQVRRGIKPEDALDILRLKVDNPQFGDFIINIKQNIKHRGDTRKLLSNMEEQFYRMEEEYNRRKISTLRDRIIIYTLMFAVFFICYGFIRINPEVEAFYLETVKGRLLVTLYCVLYAIGLYISLGISSYEH